MQQFAVDILGSAQASGPRPAVHVLRNFGNRVQGLALVPRRSCSATRRGWQRPAQRHILVPHSVAATATASGGGSFSSMAGQQQQQAYREVPALQVSVEFVLTVPGVCTLRARGSIQDTWEAFTVAVLAAALVNIHQRQQVLDDAVVRARRELPGALDAGMLKRFDDMKASGGSGAGMALLGFGQLQALCSHISPGLCREVEQEIVQEAARVKIRNMVPIPPASSGSLRSCAGEASWTVDRTLGHVGEASWRRSGSSSMPLVGPWLKERPGFDLPSAVVRLPQWQGWLRRLRDTVVAWQEEQREQQGPRGKAAPETTLVPPSPAATEHTPKGNLVGVFTTACATPDGLPMKQQIRITVAQPGGHELLKQLRENPSTLGAFGAAVDTFWLAGVVTAPEQQLQQALEAAAWSHVHLDPSCSFTCTLHPAEGNGDEEQAAAAAAAGIRVPAAGAAAPPASGSDAGCASSGAGSTFEFGGSSFDLHVLVLALSWMLGSEQSASGTSAWFPSDGRIRLQRRSGEHGNGWRWPWRRQPQAAAQASYRLQVWPPAPNGGAQVAGGAAGALQQQQQQGEEEEEDAARTTELSQRQLDALMDCLDAFCQQHPGFVKLPLPDSLCAPPLRLDSLARGRAGSGKGSGDVLTGAAAAAAERGCGTLV